MFTLKNDGAFIASQEEPIEYDVYQYAWRLGKLLISDTNKSMTVTSDPVVPDSVTMRQAVIALLDADLLDDIELIVSTLPRRYQLEWERASDVYRDNALVETVRIQKGMTPQEIDALFIAASTI